MNIIKGTLMIGGEPIWIWVDHIVLLKPTEQGGTVIHTIDGSALALTDTPETVLATIDKLLKS